MAVGADVVGGTIRGEAVARRRPDLGPGPRWRLRLLLLCQRNFRGCRGKVHNCEVGGYGAADSSTVRNSAIFSHPFSQPNMIVFVGLYKVVKL